MLCGGSQCSSVVLEHCETARRERPHGNGIKRSGVERKAKGRREDWSELSVRVIAKGKRVGEGWQWKLESMKVYARVLHWREWKGRTRQAKGTPINTFWLPQVSQGSDRSMGKGKEEGWEDRKITTPDTRQRIQRSVISSARLSNSLQATHGNDLRWCRGLMFSPVRLLLTVNECSDTLLPNAHVLDNLSRHQSFNLCVCNSLLNPNTIESSKVEG